MNTHFLYLMHCLSYLSKKAERSGICLNDWQTADIQPMIYCLLVQVDSQVLYYVPESHLVDIVCTPQTLSDPLGLLPPVITQRSTD